MGKQAPSSPRQGKAAAAKGTKRIKKTHAKYSEDHVPKATARRIAKLTGVRGFSSTSDPAVHGLIHSKVAELAGIVRIIGEYTRASSVRTRDMDFAISHLRAAPGSRMYGDPTSKARRAAKVDA